MRAILDWFDLKRLTTQVGTSLRDILYKQFPYVDDFLMGSPNETDPFVARIALARSKGLSWRIRPRMQEPKKDDCHG